MKNPRIMYAPTSFYRRGFEKSPKNTSICRRTHAGHNHYQDRRHLEEKGKGTGHILQIGGWGLGRKTPISSHNVSFYTQIYQVGHEGHATRSDQYILFPTTTPEDFVNTSESVSSGNRTDCREVYFFFRGGI